MKHENNIKVANEGNMPADEGHLAAIVLLNAHSAASLENVGGPSTKSCQFDHV